MYHVFVPNQDKLANVVISATQRTDDCRQQHFHAKYFCIYEYDLCSLICAICKSYLLITDTVCQQWQLYVNRRDKLREKPTHSKVS